MRAIFRLFIFVGGLWLLAGSAGPWLRAARPTHTPVRENRRVVVPAGGHGSGHVQPQRAQKPARHTTATGHAGRRVGGSGRSRRATRRSAGERVGRRRGRVAGAPAMVSEVPVVDRATSDRVHAWEKTQERVSAAGAVATGVVATGAAEDAGASAPANVTELPAVRTIGEEAATPMYLAPVYDGRGRLVVPAPLYGSHEVLVHQNAMADHDGLTRVQDESDLTELRRERKLVALPVGAGLRIDGRLPANRRYTRPWTAAFLEVVARDFYAKFHEPLQVNSAVRTVQIQQRLLRTNGNAAPAAGETASPHLTGQAVDLGKREMSLAEIAWMRTYLTPLMEQGKIDVEEEFQQSCFHISVYRAYAEPAGVSVAAAQARAVAGPAN